MTLFKCHHQVNIFHLVLQFVQLYFVLCYVELCISTLKGQFTQINMSYVDRCWVSRH